MGSLSAPLVLVVARVRHRPSRWLPSAIGLALAVAFALGIVVEATIAGDQGARTVLRDTPPLDRTVRLTTSGPADPGAALVPGLPGASRVTMLNAIRLSGVVVRPIGIAPLARWLTTPASVAPLGACRPVRCPVLLVGGHLLTNALRTFGVNLVVVGRTRLASAAPLGFDPAVVGGPPVIVTGDPAGLDRLAGLSSVYRTQNLVTLAGLAQLHSWQLAGVERHLQQLQAGLAGGGPTLTAPFAALDAARAQASGAPSRLLAAGGGAIAALSVFLILSAAGLRHDRRADVRRLQAAGATAAQRGVFAIAESGLLCLVGLAFGTVAGLVAGVVLAGAAGLPAGPVLQHALLTTTVGAGLIGGWATATAVVGLVLLSPSGRVADVLAVAAAAALALALVRGSDVPAGLLAPLVCVCAGALVFRAAAALLRGLERVSRGGRPLVRLALVGLARAPTGPAMAIAFIAVSTGLGGFALGYRATLLRGAADQAADQVPLAARIIPDANFDPPLELAPLARWRALSGGVVLPVRRTDATYPADGADVTIPALGVPATELTRIGGWRSSDGSAPLTELARRLTPHGPVRTPGPVLDGQATVRIAAGTRLQLIADLRRSSGTITRVDLGPALPRARIVRLPLTPRHVELAALELDEPTGLEVTNGHQNGEGVAAATQATTDVRLGPLTVSGRTVPIGTWRGVGAATAHPRTATRLTIAFSESGSPGIIRPAQPADTGSIPVLVDPGASGAARNGRLALTVDGLSVSTRIVGTLWRFPTVPPGAAGFVIADQATLTAALDASLPGQGRPDELWLTTPHGQQRLRAALTEPPLGSLGAQFRSDVQRGLRNAPVPHAVLGTLTAAAVLAVVLAVIGLLSALLGPLRDRRVENDLERQGLAPRTQAQELRLRVMIASSLGLVAGLAVAATLVRLTVAAVRAASDAGPVWPPLIAVEPWLGLVLAGAGLLVVFTLTGAVAGHRRGRP